jgi:sortase (surface protein transpeptidase)
VFYRLHELTIGDTVQVGRVYGSMLTFRVYRVQEVRKSAFSSVEVYGNVPRPELRLITCGGTWVGGQYGYQDNWVIYAST